MYKYYVLCDMNAAGFSVEKTVGIAYYAVNPEDNEAAQEIKKEYDRSVWENYSGYMPDAAKHVSGDMMRKDIDTGEIVNTGKKINFKVKA